MLVVSTPRLPFQLSRRLGAFSLKLAPGFCVAAAIKRLGGLTMPVSTCPLEPEVAETAPPALPSLLPTYKHAERQPLGALDVASFFSVEGAARKQGTLRCGAATAAAAGQRRHSSVGLATLSAPGCCCPEGLLECPCYAPT